MRTKTKNKRFKIRGGEDNKDRKTEGEVKRPHGEKEKNGKKIEKRGKKADGVEQEQ